MRYTNGMDKEITFQLDIQAAEKILTDIAMPTIQRSGAAIAARAESMAGSLSSKPISISVSSTVGTIRRGRRAIATVSAQGVDAHGNYVGAQALAKAKDAGRI